MNKLFLMEELHEGKWIPHSKWNMDFRTILCFLQDKPEELRNRRRIRGINSWEETELPINLPSITT